MKITNKLGYIKKEVFGNLKENPSNLPLIADLIRFNTLLSVARAGTGHLGASLSIVEMLTEIYFRSFKFDPKTKDNKDRDIFILSKGHAAPSLYAVLAAKGYFDTARLDKLRRIGGLAGHCDISTPGIEANTGSLAMGLSKAVGYALAKKRFNHKGNVIVIVGDGELQEGQCWEAFLSAASFKLNNLYIIIDDNDVQTDQYTKNIVRYGNLVSAFKDLGYSVFEGTGQNIKDINKAFTWLKSQKNKPKVFYAHTLKGQGISYMEHPKVLKNSEDRYIWHNKPPDLVKLKNALDEIFSRIEIPLHILGYTWDLNHSLTSIPKEPMQQGIMGDSLTKGFSQALLKLAEQNSKIVVLDGDLEEDCGFIPFHEKYPKRFFEMGIMEQNLVSVACTFGRAGYIPVISTYAAFLTSRANEQIYNLASEGVKALIVGNMSGVIPATPGKSHQAFRDISCMKNIPGITMYQPVSSDDVKNILSRYLKNDFGKILYLRLSMASSPENIKTPEKNIEFGKTQLIRSGKNAIIIGIGPVVLGEALEAAKILSLQKISLEVRNHPWLIDFDKNDFRTIAMRNLPLILVEDHYIKGGFAESLLSFLNINKIGFPKIAHFGLKDFPQTGFRDESLKEFGLYKDKISEKVRKLLK